MSSNTPASSSTISKARPSPGAEANASASALATTQNAQASESPGLGQITDEVGHSIPMPFLLVDSRAPLAYAVSWPVEEYEASGAQLAFLALQFLQQHDRDGRMIYLEEGIGYSREANGKLSRDDPAYTSNLTNLARALSRKFQATKDVKILDDLMKISQSAAGLWDTTAPRDSQAALWMLWAAAERFKVTKLWRDLEEGIRLAELYISSTPQQHERYHEFKEYTAFLYQMKFEQTRNSADLKKAVWHSGQAILSMGPAHPKLDAFLHEHLSRVHVYSTLLDEIPEVEHLIAGVGPLVTSLQESVASNDVTQCAVLYANLLSRLYYLSSKPSDMLRALHQARKMASTLKENQVVEYLDLGIQKVSRLVETPQDDPIATQVAAALHSSFCAQSNTPRGKSTSLWPLVHASLLEKIVVRVQINEPNTLQMLSKDVVIARLRLAQSLKVSGMSLAHLVGVSSGDVADPERFNQVVTKTLAEYNNLLDEIERSGVCNSEQIQHFKRGRSEFENALLNTVAAQQRPREDLEALQKRISSLSLQCDNSTALEARVDHTYRLCYTMARLYNRSPESCNLDQLVENFEKLVELLAELYTRCQQGEYRGREDVSVEKVIELRERATLELSTLLGSRFLKQHSPQDLERSKELSQRVVQEAKEAKERAQDRTRSRGKGKDENGASKDEKAELKESEYANRPREDEVRSLAALARSLRLKYKFHDGTIEDLNAAVPLLEKALRDARKIVKFPRTSVAEMANDWGLLMRARYKAFGGLGDLNAGIETMTEVLEDGTKSSGDLGSDARGYLLSNLSLLHYDKYHRTHSRESLEASIACSEKSLGTGRVFLGTSTNLANGWLERYYLSNDVEDLERAVKLVRQDVGALSTSRDLAKSEGGVIMIDASLIFIAAYTHWRDPAYLDEAYRCAKHAVDVPPANRTIYPGILFEFANISEARYNQDPSPAGREQCIQAYLAAWKREGPGATALVRVQAAKSVTRLLVADQRLQECEDIATAVVRLLPQSCPRWMAAVDRHHALTLFTGFPSDAAALCLRHQHSQQNVVEALRLLELGRGVILGSAIEYRSAKQRLQAHSPDIYRRYNELCLLMDTVADEAQNDSKLSAYQRLVKELGEVVQEIRQLEHFPDFSPPIHAGSGTASRLSLDSPTLYRRYFELHRRLSSLSDADSGRRSNKRRETSVEMDKILASVRSTPGMEDLLLPLDEPSMLALAREGPIVVINSSSLVGRSDAILIRESGIDVLPLEGLTLEDLQAWTSELLSMTTSWSPRNFAAKNKKMREYLLWLWEAAVRPIFERLGLQPSEDMSLKPRLHWVGVGPLSWTPFHAAGDHSPGSLENSMSYVVSSYSPTLRSLAYAREQMALSPGALSKQSRLLLVTAPDTPGMAELAGVREEMDAVGSICDPKLSVVRLEDPGVDEVASQLPLANIVHFACHGVSSPLDPDSSHLVLHGRSSSSSSSSSDDALVKEVEDVEEEAAAAADTQQLSVRRISASRSPSAALAYLSACSAADNRSASLADEAIYIASAFHVAGFRHVIATLWLAKDDICPQVAGGFYSALLRRSESGSDNGSGVKERRRVRAPAREPLEAAQALHEAVDQVRTRYWSKPLLWAPFVHIGS